MKFAKMIDKFSELLSASRRRQREKREKLLELLKEMKKQQKALREELEHTEDPAQRALLEIKHQVITEQRKKGVRLRKELAEEKRKQRAKD
jgi:hypothetical protein